jgi:dienelactone hydrolase
VSLPETPDRNVSEPSKPKFAHGSRGMGECVTMGNPVDNRASMWRPSIQPIRLLWLVALPAFLLGLGAGLLIPQSPRPRAQLQEARPNAESGSSQFRCSQFAPGSEESQRCHSQTSSRPEIGPPLAVRSLPAELGASCPGPFDKHEVGTDPDTLASSVTPLKEVKGGWVEFASADGLVIPGYLARPVDGGTYPGVVWAHGGFFEDVDTDVVEAIASGGYVVIGVAYRGSSGHGPELERAIDIAGREVDDVAAGGRFLQGRSGVRSGSIAVAGGSHGGSLALAAAYRYPRLFDAVADFYGVTDWACITYLLTPRLPTALIQYSFGGTPVEVPDEYKRRSAYYNAEDIDVPVYVAHGILDHGIPPGESLKLVDRLRANGTPVTARFFPGKDHGFFQKESPTSVYWNDFFRFLDTSLG